MVFGFGWEFLASFLEGGFDVGEFGFEGVDVAGDVFEGVEAFFSDFGEADEGVHLFGDDFVEANKVVEVFGEVFDFLGDVGDVLLVFLDLEIEVFEVLKNGASLFEVFPAGVSRWCCWGFFLEDGCGV